WSSVVGIARLRESRSGRTLGLDVAAVRDGASPRAAAPRFFVGGTRSTNRDRGLELPPLRGAKRRFAPLRSERPSRYFALQRASRGGGEKGFREDAAARIRRTRPVRGRQRPFASSQRIAASSCSGSKRTSRSFARRCIAETTARQSDLRCVRGS